MLKYQIVWKFFRTNAQISNCIKIRPENAQISNCKKISPKKFSNIKFMKIRPNKFSNIKLNENSSEQMLKYQIVWKFVRTNTQISNCMKIRPKNAQISNCKKIPPKKCSNIKLYENSSEKCSNIKLYENSSSGSRVFPSGQTDGHRQTDMTKLTVAFRYFAKASNKHVRIKNLCRRWRDKLPDNKDSIREFEST